MENDSGLEFDFFLAQKLSMTVADLRERMSSQEWLEWSVYYARIAQQRELQAKRR